MWFILNESPKGENDTLNERIKKVEIKSIPKYVVDDLYKLK